MLREIGGGKLLWQLVTYFAGFGPVEYAHCRDWISDEVHHGYHVPYRCVTEWFHAYWMW